MTNKQKVGLETKEAELWNQLVMCPYGLGDPRREKIAEARWEVRVQLDWEL